MANSDDPLNPAKGDPNRPKVAPPPPPPATARLDGGPGKAPGFDASGKRAWTEGLVGVALVLGLGAAVVFAGGALAAWATPFVPLSVDRKLGEMSKEQFAAQAPDCTDESAKKYVEALGERILASRQDLPFDFEFRVADTEQVNAFALPGGFVTVNWGLIQKAETGEEIAGVLGHEIQHALLRHGTKRMLRQMGGSALMLLLFGGTDLHQLSHLAGQLAGLSYDRSQESEADLRGVDLLVDSQIDPAGLATFFERLNEDGVRPPELLSTHPDPGDRAQLVKAARQGETFLPLPPPIGLSCH